LSSRGRLSEPKTREVVEEETLPGGEGVGAQGVHHAQEPLHFFPIHRMETRDVEISPPLPIDLVFHQLGGIVGVRQLDPTARSDPAFPPPTVPESEPDDAGDEEREDRDPERHGRKTLAIKGSIQAIPLPNQGKGPLRRGLGSLPQCI